MRIIYLIAIVIFPNLLFSQTEDVIGSYQYKITYSLKYQPDSTNAENMETDNMVLFVGDKISRFLSEGHVMKDSILNANPKSKSWGAFNKLMSQVPNYKFKYFIYKRVPEGKLSFIKCIGNNNFRYTERLNQIKWEIAPETKELFGYKAHKAKTHFAGRDYIAWFTQEVPISDGPYKFQGLPGLIIKIHDTENDYDFAFTGLKKLKKPVKVKFSKKDFVTITQSKMRRAKEQNDRHPFAQLKGTGITLDFKKGEKERMMRQHREKMKKRNNPIELE